MENRPLGHGSDPARLRRMGYWVPRTVPRDVRHRPRDGRSRNLWLVRDRVSGSKPLNSMFMTDGLYLRPKSRRCSGIRTRSRAVEKGSITTSLS